MKSMTEHLINNYGSECAAIYADEDMKGPTRGALLAAASKRAKVAYIFSRLRKEANRYNVDLTLTHAHRSICRIIGRGVSFNEVRKAFATEGRTAAEKSRIDAEKMEKIEKKIKEELCEFELRLQDKRLSVKT